MSTTKSDSVSLSVNMTKATNLDQETEWTDFGSNALFASKREEANEERHHARLLETPKEQVHATKSSSGRLRQKSLERHKQIGKFIANDVHCYCHELVSSPFRFLTKVMLCRKRHENPNHEHQTQE